MCVACFYVFNECHPTYLGVTLDRTLSYREHLTKTARKLKNRNNLLMKLAGSTWGASANTLWSSAPALCYSAAEYCTVHPSLVTLCSHKSGRCAVELYHDCYLCLRSTPLSALRQLVKFCFYHTFTIIFSPTLNRQPYKGRLPLTSWWRKLSNMTVG